ncbi:hypothetical protein [Microbispora sp. KK1-11]|uniref:hypothetical protein n=1 Tax=Microbispora sp. KK1-11 TaxID=2053005 RepID=UPI00115894BD|nr:hypothetical protein [Microbispora sp. KK1-11]TQS29122.1 hypothetical protein FLW16_12310 [Microbispora sp. KK1-11]
MAAPVAPSNGDFINRAFWKREVSDRWSDLYSPWTYYAPAWSASTTAPVLGNGTLVGAYLPAGKTVYLRLRLQIGSGTNVGSGAWSFSLPTDAQPAFIQGMQGFVANAGGTVRWPMTAFLTTANGIERMGISNNIVGSAVPFAWAAGDQLVLTGAYEI